MRPARATAAVLASVLLLSSCSQKVKIGGPELTASPTKIATTRPASKRPRATPTPTADTTGTLLLAVEDEQTRYRRSGIPVTYRGPRSGTLVTDAEGVARIRLPAGDYKIQVKTGCHTKVEVFRGTGGTAGVAPGQAPAIAVLKVNARLRYWGGTPLQHSITPPWPAGETVTFRYRLYDRCRDVEAPGKASAFTYRTDTNLQIVGTPARIADGSSDIVMQLRCRAYGDARLFIVDAETEEELDLLGLRPPVGSDPDVKWCAGAA